MREPVLPAPPAPPPIRLPSGLTVAVGAQLRGEYFGDATQKDADLYVLQPQGWSCNTLFGGTGENVSVYAGPAVPYPGAGDTFVSQVFNFDGAGGDEQTICEEFVTLAPTIRRQHGVDCGPLDLPAGATVMALPSVAPGLQAVVETDPPGVGTSMSNTDFKLFLYRAAYDLTYLQGNECAVPGSQRALCVEETTLYLATTGATRQLSATARRALTGAYARLVEA